ncbi:LOW QUALITY PROTEIN: protein-glutamine gamma-glutamyltransferase Z [Trichechus inunguis]
MGGIIFVGQRKSLCGDYLPPCGGYLPVRRLPPPVRRLPPAVAVTSRCGGYLPPCGGYLPPCGGYLPPCGGYLPVRRLPPPVRRLPPAVAVTSRVWRLPPPVWRLPPVVAVTSPRGGYLPPWRLPPPVRWLPPPVRLLPPPVRWLPAPGPQWRDGAALDGRAVSGAKCIIPLSGTKQNAGISKGDCIFSLCCNYGHREEDIFFLPSSSCSFLTKPRIRPGQGKVKLAVLQNYAFSVAALELSSADLQNPRKNKEHHTQEMGLKRLIVPRCQVFIIILNFNQSFQPQINNITYMAETGSEPTELLGTRATFSVTQAQHGNVWSASDFTIDLNSLRVSVFTPANAVIGPYTLMIQIYQGQGHSMTYLVGTFILLFNPWSAEDDVYLPSEILLQEYIMMDYGFVYKGRKRFITAWPWNYGQFEDDVIDICLEILNKSLYFLKNPSKDHSQWNDVVYVCRVVSAIINSIDDNGVLQGNWGQDYGVSPLEWNGSVAILRRWSAQGGQPVQYGQCRVFAAVMCAVMRCLGVPARIVSNFRSVHNMDGTLTIDTYCDQNAEMLPTQRPDKIWDFHIWNECWMIRKDLPPGYNGWQVLDPTPQQTSSGLFCCGPASVKAIREGEVHLAYDPPFVYAEVNADEVIWLLGDGQAQESIGKEISTKTIGSEEHQNITSSYRYPEGSPEERSVFMKASRSMLGQTRASSPFLDLLGSSGVENQPAQLHPHLARTPQWGQDLLLTLCAWRVPDRAHPQGPIRLVLRFCAQLHGRGTQEPLWRQEVCLNLDFGQETQWLLLLPYNNYRNRLTDEKLIRVSGIAQVEETGRSMLVLKDISLEPPHLSTEVSKRAEVGKALRVRIGLTNNQMEPLSNCIMVLERSGLIHGQISKSLETLMAGHTLEIQLDLYPIKAGPRQLQVLISSNKVKEIKGYRDIFVTAARAS